MFSPDIQTYQIGELYCPTRTIWEERNEWNYRADSHDLLITWKEPTPFEIKMVRESRVEFRIYEFGSAIFFLFRFGDGPWCDNPYSWHLVNEADRTLPDPEPLLNARALLDIFLVDASTGILKAMRCCTFSPEFTSKLEAMVREQAARPFDRDIHDEDIRITYYNYRTSNDLAKAAVLRCFGGD